MTSRHRKTWRHKVAEWLQNKRSELKALGQLLKRWPSTLIWPCLLLSFIIGLGIWGVTYIEHKDIVVEKERARTQAEDAAMWLEQELSIAIAPVLTLSAMVVHRPQYADVVDTFTGLAPALLNFSKVASGCIRALQLIPHGVIDLVYPVAGNVGARGLNLLNSSATNRQALLGAVQDRTIAVAGPLKIAQGGIGIAVRMPIFVPDVGANENFGIPFSWSNCGPLCDYDSANRTALWGLAAGLIDLGAIIRSNNSKLHSLSDLGYSYEVEARDSVGPEDLRIVARSASRPVSSVEAGIHLPKAVWVVRVAPTHGWARPWYAPMLAGVVVLAVLGSALLFIVLVSRRRHQLLLEALLPKEMIRDMNVNEAASLGARIQRPDTPADLLMKMMGELLQGRVPDLRDVVFIRTALLRNADVYQPLNLRGRLKEANFDSDVVQALMRQLGGGGTHGPGSDQYTTGGGGSSDEPLGMLDVDSCARVGIQLGPGRCSVLGDDCGGMRWSSNGGGAYSRGWAGAFANFGRGSGAAAAAAAAAAAQPQPQANYDTLSGALTQLLSPQMMMPPPPVAAAAPVDAPLAAVAAAMEQEQQQPPSPIAPSPAITFLGLAATAATTAAPSSVAPGGGPLALLSLSPAAFTTTRLFGTHSQWPLDESVHDGGEAFGAAAAAALMSDSQHIVALGNSLKSLSGAATVAAAAAGGGTYPSGSFATGGGHAASFANSPGGSGAVGSGGGGSGGGNLRALAAERERGGGGDAANSTAAGGGAAGSSRVAGSAMSMLARVASAAIPHFGFRDRDRDRDGGGGGGGGGGGHQLHGRSATAGSVLEVLSASNMCLEGGGGGLDETTGGRTGGITNGGGGGRSTKAAAGASGAMTSGQLPMLLLPPPAAGTVPDGLLGGGATVAGGAASGAFSRHMSRDGHAVGAGGGGGATRRLSGLLTGGGAGPGGVAPGSGNLRLQGLTAAGSGSLSPVAAHVAAASGGRPGSAAQHTAVALSPAVLNAPPPVPAPPPPIIEEVEQVLAGVDSWTFDAWKLAEVTQGHALSALAFYLMHREGLIAKFQIKPAVLARLLRALEAGYQPNPYHNATHAADVLQTLHVVIHGAGLHVHYLDRLGLLAAYFAAIVHDHNHPGLTNDFLITTNDMLAIRYNDKSPLENHHTASCFGLMALQPELDALAPLSQTEKSGFRKQVIEMVMGTDMKQHFGIMAHFNTVHRLASYSAQQAAQQVATAAAAARRTGGGMATTSASGAAAGGRSSGGGGSKGGCSPGDSLQLVCSETAPKPLDDKERMLSLQIALKVADIGHLGESLAVHKRWLAGLEEEFFNQGDRERDLGIPISPLFDRAKQGVSKSQVGFYDFVGLPLVHAMAGAFPGAKPLKACFERNYEHWKVVEAQQQASKKADTPGAGGGGGGGAAAQQAAPPPQPPQQLPAPGPASGGAGGVAAGGSGPSAAAAAAAAAASVMPASARAAAALGSAGPANGTAAAAAGVPVPAGPTAAAPATAAVAAPVAAVAAAAAQPAPRKQQSRSRLAVAATAATAATAAGAPPTGP